MDCGTPFCNSGGPVNHIVPDFNDPVYRADWKNGWAVLDSTNNFPEFTGRICPAPCEAACPLNIMTPGGASKVSSAPSSIVLGPVAAKIRGVYELVSNSIAAMFSIENSLRQ